MPAIETERVVDVRTVEDPPFDAILAALGDLTAEPVVVIDSAEPTALYDALGGRDLSYRTTRRDGDWHVRVTAEEGRRATDPRSRTDRGSRIDRDRAESIADLANPELL
jgi:hypothetical protein